MENAYSREKLKEEVVKAISKTSSLKNSEVMELLEKPPRGINADFSFPCFKLAKERKESPAKIAGEIGNGIKLLKDSLIGNVEVAGPYVNFYSNWNVLGNGVVSEVLGMGDRYGSSKSGKGKNIVIDYSSCNIAKPMGIGHLRSTIIGDSLYRIFSFLGYKCIGDNHLGDWGTQFGKLIYAYNTWGDKKKVENEPIKELLKLYTKFHVEAEKDPSLEEEGRKAFKELEEGNKEYKELWKWFVEVSLKDFDRIYKDLGVKFDHYLGESFYLDMLDGVIGDSLSKGVAKEESSAVVLKLDKYKLPDTLLRKSDGATLYITRDLATVKYRKENFNFHKAVYVVGMEQKLHFQQLFQVADLIGYAKKEDLIHVDFGYMFSKEGKFSTRKGNVIYLEDVISEAVKRAEKIIKEKGKSKDLERLSKQIGIGAIKYNDLSRDRVKNITFDWDVMLNFEGDTAPYIQYTHARACSILKKAKKGKIVFRGDRIKSEKEVNLLRLLMEFPDIVELSARNYKPNYIANHVFDLATAFNNFYESLPVLKAEKPERDNRLLVTKATKTVINNALGLLGIEAPESM